MTAPVWVKHITLMVGRTYDPTSEAWQRRQRMIAETKAAPAPCGCFGHDAPYLCEACLAKVGG